MHNNKQNKTLLEHYYLFSLQKNKRTKKILRFFLCLEKVTSKRLVQIPRQAFWFTDQIDVKKQTPETWLAN